MTYTGDYQHWEVYDLDRGHFTQEQKAHFDNKAVWLCARCEDVGCRSGSKLARKAEDGKELAHKITSLH